MEVRKMRGWPGKIRGENRWGAVVNRKKIGRSTRETGAFGELRKGKGRNAKALIVEGGGAACGVQKGEGKTCPTIKKNHREKRKGAAEAL